MTIAAMTIITCYIQQPSSDKWPTKVSQSDIYKQLINRLKVISSARSWEIAFGIRGFL